MVIDWATLITDMQWLLGEEVQGFPDQRAPIGTRSMAVDLGVSRDLVRNWLAGVSPKHHEGELLIARWLALTSKSRMFLPMTRAVFSASKVARG